MTKRAALRSHRDGQEWHAHRSRISGGVTEAGRAMTLPDYADPSKAGKISTTRLTNVEMPQRVAVLCNRWNDSRVQPLEHIRITDIGPVARQLDRLEFEAVINLRFDRVGQLVFAARR